VSSYNVIYGGFAALPLFVIWLQITWMIVLFGSELSFFYQHHEAYRHKEKFSELSFTWQKVLALKITHLIIKEFSNNAKPLNAYAISSRLSLPLSFVFGMLDKLLKSRIIVEAKYEEDQDAVFLPAQDINAMTVASVFEDLENCGNNRLPFIAEEDDFVFITHQFTEYQIEQDENKLLKEITLVQHSAK
jgi:membrane protein